MKRGYTGRVNTVVVCKNVYLNFWVRYVRNGASDDKEYYRKEVRGSEREKKKRKNAESW